MTDEYDLQSELNRKALEALSWLSNERDRGSITEDAFQVSLKTFDMTVLGLIDGDVSEWVSDARTMGKVSHRYTDKTVLLEVGVVSPRTLVIDLCRVSATVKTSLIDGRGLVQSKVEEFEKHTDQVKAANEYYLSRIANFLTKNFEVLS